MIIQFRRRLADDSGVGMVLVMGIIGIVTTMVVTASVLAISALRASANRVAFEQSLAAAENGVDWALARLQKAFDDYNADYPVPSGPSMVEPSPQCNTSPVADPGTFATQAAEEAWVQAQFRSLLTTHPECVQRGGQGEFLVLKPSTPLVNGQYPKYGRVYAMGWAPSRSAARAVTRTIKAEYLFLPYRPTHAVLTGGDTVLDSSTTVTAAFGVDPAEASVHTNRTITEINGNPTVTGPVTSSLPSSGGSNRFQSNPGGSVTIKKPQRIPTVSARSIYFHAVASDPTAASRWYDLCPNGDVKSWSASGPCTGAVLNGGAPSFRGWTHDSGSHTWIATRNTENGIYFAHESNVDVGPGNGEIENITVIASAQNPTSCNTKRYGNIVWDHFTMRAPSYPNLFLLADSDIATGANFTAGSGITAPPVVSGMFVAGDQIQLETSSSGAVGSVLAGDQCDTSDLVDENEVKNPTVYYDPKSDAPFTSIISTTLWLEYPGVKA